MKNVLTLLILACSSIATSFAQDIHYVNLNATGNNDGTSWIDAYTDVQMALDSASINDSIWVAQGTYNGNFSYPDAKDLVVLGGFNGTELQAEDRDWVTNPTILDANNSGRVMITNYLSSAAVLDGFTLQNGQWVGAGMRNKSSNIRLKNLHFFDNDAPYGGGMYNHDTCMIEMTDCIMTYNSANTAGGAIHNIDYSELILTNVTFSHNEATSGGAVFNQLDAKVYMYQCVADSNFASNFAGAVYNAYGGEMFIEECSFTGNSSDDGGAIGNLPQAKLEIKNSHFEGNIASQNGGAIEFESSDSIQIENTIFYNNQADAGGAIDIQDGAIVVLNNSIFIDNSATSYGGALLNEGDSQSNLSLVNSTFYNNNAADGATCYLSSSGTDTVANCIFYGNTSTSGLDFQASDYLGNLLITSSLMPNDTIGWGGNYVWDASNLTPGSNPFFEDENDAQGADGIWMTNDDGFILTSSSPCAGTGSSLLAPTMDITGTTRPNPVSMGAYESYCSFDTVAPTPLAANLPDIISPCAVDSIPEPMVMDECSVLITNDAVFPIASNATVTWTYTDLIGNVSTQQQNIVISGAINTQVSQPDEITLEAQNTAATSYEWIDCSTQNAISGATSAQFTATSNGQYAVVVTEGNCSDTSACFTIDQVGLNAMSNKHLLLAPNPSNGGTVNVLGDGELSNIRMMDAAGKRIPIEINWNQRSFNTEHLSAGTYFVQLDSAQSSATQILLITSN